MSSDPKADDSIACMCAGVHLTADLWRSIGGDVLNANGKHSPTACIEWPSLPDAEAAICKRLAGTLKENP